MTQGEIWKRDIVLFLISQIVSLLGSSLVQYAIMWYITLQTQSGTMMTIFIICGFLPTFFLSPFAGVWADRYNRKKIIIFADAFIAIATLILAILYLMGYGSIWLLFVMSAIRAFGSGIHSPAINAVLPQLVPDYMLTKINAINGTLQSMVFLIAPMISAALIEHVKIETIFFIDVITAALAIFIITFFVKVPDHAKVTENQNIDYFSDLKEGISYIRNHAYVKQFFLFCTVFFLLVSPLAFLTPLQVTRSYGDDVWRLSAVEIAWSVGMMLGGLLMATWNGFKNKIYTMTLSTIVTAIGTIVLGIRPFFWIYLVSMGIMGLTMPLFNTPSTVILQQKVDQDYLGRVFGVLNMISSSVMPLAMLFFGPLADVIKIEIMLLVTGILMFFLSFFLIRSKVMLDAGKD
jgi:DHA3 family macrolide efflux protein-like MFS transporter